MGDFLTSADLTEFVPAPLKTALADALIEDAEAMALIVAPCLNPIDDLTATQKAAVKAVLRQAVVRRYTAGDGTLTMEMAGAFQYQNSINPAGNTLWPSEIERLKLICSSSGRGAAIIDVLSADPNATVSAHLDWCSLVLGATFCSCGVDIAGEPIFELQ